MALVADPCSELVAVESTAMVEPRVDPAQPPKEDVWADEWLRLARRRLSSGLWQVASSAARVAQELDSSLKGEVDALIIEAEHFRFHRVEVPGRGVLMLAVSPESAQHEDRLNTGGLVWSASERLAHLLPRLASLTGRRVLDIGSGTGCAGLAAALCGAEVVLADLPAAMSLLQTNVARHQAEVRRQRGSAVQLALDWREPVGAACLEPCDLVLACDPVWLPEQCEPLVRWLGAFGAPCIFPITPRTLRPGVNAALRASWSAGCFEIWKILTAADDGEVLLLVPPASRTSSSLPSVVPSPLPPWLLLQALLVE
eukprot:TRINITY_DN68351_c0_g1_i1.p1 TRINITY_DN68351_c0_g1~~TRINITY_DN68351_c0_g1_i1.p1  ORF type:complete len:313 (+),score=49.92 TRINITY_DN68351_c0_g1_i1:80-1018(+)